MKNYMSTSKWIIYNQKGEKVGQRTLKHKDGGIYKELEPFDKELKEKDLSACDEEVLNQGHLKNKTFKEKLIYLGYID